MKILFKILALFWIILAFLKLLSKQDNTFEWMQFFGWAILSEIKT